MSEEALQIAEKREAKGKGEKERYTHLNAEFQRIAERDKKDFLSDQCKQKENNRMISVPFQGKPFNITVIQVYALTSNAEEAEVDWFYVCRSRSNG